MMERDEAAKTPMSPLISSVAIIIGTIFMAGLASGLLAALAEDGRALAAPWVGAIAACLAGLAVLTLYLKRTGPFWQGWSARRRRYWLSLAIAAVAGIVVSIMLNPANEAGGVGLLGDGPVSQTTAWFLSLLWLGAMAVSLAIYHRSVDDHERMAYFQGALAGFNAFALAAPVWWIMARANLLPPPDVMLLFIGCLTVNAVVYLWHKFR